MTVFSLLFLSLPRWACGKRASRITQNIYTRNVHSANQITLGCGETVHRCALLCCIVSYQHANNNNNKLNHFFSGKRITKWMDFRPRNWTKSTWNAFIYPLYILCWFLFFFSFLLFFLNRNRESRKSGSVVYRITSH